MKQLLLLALMLSSTCYADTSACEAELGAFPLLTAQKKAHLCNALKTDEAVKAFNSCLLSQAQDSNNTLRPQRLGEPEENGFSAILTRCYEATQR